MYNYIIGKVTIQENNYIVVENNGIGYTIYVANPFSFEENKESKVYVYNQIVYMVLKVLKKEIYF